MALPVNGITPSVRARRPEDAPLRGVILTVIGVLMLVGISACFKYLATKYPPLEIVGARYFFSFVVVLFLFPRRIPRLFSSNHPKLQLVRGLTAVGATVLATYALRQISIAEVVAITFIAPTLTIALVSFVLGEQAGACVGGRCRRIRWGADDCPFRCWRHRSVGREVAATDGAVLCCWAADYCRVGHWRAHP